MTEDQDSRASRYAERFARGGVKIVPSPTLNVWHVVSVKRPADSMFINLYKLAKMTYDVSDASMDEIVQYVGLMAPDLWMELVAFKSQTEAHIFADALKLCNFQSSLEVRAHDRLPRPPEYKRTFLG